MNVCVKIAIYINSELKFFKSSLTTKKICTIVNISLTKQYEM